MLVARKTENAKVSMHVSLKMVMAHVEILALYMNHVPEIMLVVKSMTSFLFEL